GTRLCGEAPQLSPPAWLTTVGLHRFDYERIAIDVRTPVNVDRIFRIEFSYQVAAPDIPVVDRTRQLLGFKEFNRRLGIVFCFICGLIGNEVFDPYDAERCEGK